VPAPIDRRSARITSGILAGWRDLAPADHLARLLGRPVVLDNDANLGALAELHHGAARGCPDFVYVKVAGGVGAGIVLGGRLHRGATGIAGEIGHVQVQADGVVCRCGSRGCLETVAATPALLRALQPAHREPLTVRDLVELVRSGDLGARRVVLDAGRMIGRAVGDLCNSLNPSAIVIGGDLVAAGQPLLDGVAEGVARHAQPGAAHAVRTTLGTLGDRAQVLGALVLAVSELRAPATAVPVGRA
jgi:predicted NBD/HSP70 family sugar kinase